MFQRELKNYSKQVQSNNSSVLQRQQPKQHINEKILQKYLGDEDHPIITCFDNCILRFRPYWSITQPQIYRNLSGIFWSNWAFDYITENQQIQEMRKEKESISHSVAPSQLIGKNISIFFVIWGPLSTMFFANLLHNQPFSQSKFQILSVGFIDLISILLISFAMYIYSNVLQTPYVLYCQHLCASSFVALLVVLYASICVAAPDYLLIPVTIVFTCLSIYLHFNLYNQAIKPTLIEMIVLFIIFAVAYSAAASAYCGNFSGFWRETKSMHPSLSNSTNSTLNNVAHHFFRHYNNSQ